MNKINKLPFIMVIDLQLYKEIKINYQNFNTFLYYQIIIGIQFFEI